MSTAEEEPCAKSIGDVFREWDINGSGRIRPEQLKAAVLSISGSALSSSDWDRVMSAMPDAADATMEWQKFVDYICTPPHRPSLAWMCPSCGLEAASRFCKKCGDRVEVAADAVEAQPIQSELPVVEARPMQSELPLKAKAAAPSSAKKRGSAMLLKALKNGEAAKLMDTAPEDEAPAGGGEAEQGAGAKGAEPSATAAEAEAQAEAPKEEAASPAEEAAPRQKAAELAARSAAMKRGSTLLMRAMKNGEAAKLVDGLEASQVAS